MNPAASSLSFAIVALTIVACGAMEVDEMESQEGPAIRAVPNAAEHSLSEAVDRVWVDTDPRGDGRGEAIFDPATGNWYRWNRKMGGYAIPATTEGVTLITDESGGYGIVPAPPKAFTLPRPERGESRQTRWGMALGREFVLLQEELREKVSAGPSRRVAQQLYFAANREDAPRHRIDLAGLELETPPSKLPQLVSWSPTQTRAILEQYDGASRTHSLYLFDFDRGFWREIPLEARLFDKLWSADGDRLALRVSSQLRIYDWRTDRLSAIEGTAIPLSWTADHRRLILSEAQGSEILDTATMKRIRLSETAVTGVALAGREAGWRWFGGGGWTLVRGRAGNELFRLDMEDPRLTPLHVPDEPWQTAFDRRLDPYEALAVSPDERHLAFSWNDQLWLAATREEGGSPRKIHEGERVYSILWAPDSDRLLFFTGDDCNPSELCTYSLFLHRRLAAAPEKISEIRLRSLVGPALRRWM